VRDQQSGLLKELGAGKVPNIFTDELKEEQSCLDTSQQDLEAIVINEMPLSSSRKSDFISDQRPKLSLEEVAAKSRVRERNEESDDEMRSPTHLYDSDDSQHTNSTFHQLRHSHLHHIGTDRNHL
jgi:hypothetical protein